MYWMYSGILQSGDTPRKTVSNYTYKTKGVIPLCFKNYQLLNSTQYAYIRRKEHVMLTSAIECLPCDESYYTFCLILTTIDSFWHFSLACCTSVCNLGGLASDRKQKWETCIHYIRRHFGLVWVSRVIASLPYGHVLHCYSVWVQNVRVFQKIFLCVQKRQKGSFLSYDWLVKVQMRVGNAFWSFLNAVFASLRVFQRECIK